MLFIWSYKKETNEYLTVNIATSEIVAFSHDELKRIYLKKPQICANFWLIFGHLCGKSYSVSKTLSNKAERVLCIVPNNKALCINSDGELSIVEYSTITSNLFHYSGISYYWTKYLGYPVSSWGNEFDIHVYKPKQKELEKAKTVVKAASLLNTAEFAIRFAEIKAARQNHKVD